MALNPSQRYRNVVSRVQEWYATLSLTGSPAGLFQDAPAAVDGPAVVVSIEPISATMRAVDSQSHHTMDNRALLVFDVWWPTTEQDPTVGVFDALNVVDELRDASSLLSLTFKDYTVTPGSPTTEGGAHIIRSFGPSTFTRLPDQEGYTRHRVTAAVSWDAYRTA